MPHRGTTRRAARPALRGIRPRARAAPGAAPRAAPRPRRATVNPTNPAQRGYSLGRRGAGMQGAGGPVPATPAAPRRKPVAATKRAAPKRPANAGLRRGAKKSLRGPLLGGAIAAKTPTRKEVAPGAPMLRAPSARPRPPARKRPAAAPAAPRRRAARPAAPRARRSGY